MQINSTKSQSHNHLKITYKELPNYPNKLFRWDDAYWDNCDNPLYYVLKCGNVLQFWTSDHKDKASIRLERNVEKDKGESLLREVTDFKLHITLP